MQNHYNLVYREEEREMIPLCIDQGVGVIPWSPLARGVLAGNRTRSGERLTTRSDSDPFTDYLYSQPTDFDVVDRVAELAAERSVPPAQIALAWLLHRPGVTAPIIGSTKVAHMQDALAAEQLTLDSDEMKRLEEPYVPHPVLGARLIGPSQPGDGIGSVNGFHPAVAAWFEAASPTAPPRPRSRAGHRSVSGDDTLIAAPTGSGKTLAGFLVAIDAAYRAHARRAMTCRERPGSSTSRR